MTIAVLVLGYRQPGVLSLVLPVYRQAGFDVFVHVDGKASLPAYAGALGAEAQHCRFSEPRSTIFWGGFTMVEATLNLLQSALSAGAYSRFLLVSDDTLPVASIARLRDVLNFDIDRVSAREIPSDELFYQRYQRFFMLDHPATSLLGRPIESAFMDEALFAKLARLQALRTRGKTRLPLYYGSQWWCLRRQTAELVLRLHRERDDLRESFEFSAVPDEMYIQTMVANYGPGPLAGGPVYVDWTRQPKPYVFADDSYAGALAPDQVFIRKVSARDRGFIERTLARVTSRG